jgi:HlyD family secretion protein
VNVIIDFDDPAAASRLLGDGYRVEIRATAWQSGDALAVPIGALFRSGRDWAVFVADGDRARLQSVQIGERNNEVAQVTGGLREGQRVVMHPSDALTDGTRIRARP